MDVKQLNEEIKQLEGKISLFMTQLTPLNRAWHVYYVHRAEDELNQLANSLENLRFRVSHRNFHNAYKQTI
jgi:hypothetical protein